MEGDQRKRSEYILATQHLVEGTAQYLQLCTCSSIADRTAFRSCFGIVYSSKLTHGALVPHSCSLVFM